MFTPLNSSYFFRSSLKSSRLHPYKRLKLIDLLNIFKTLRLPILYLKFKRLAKEIIVV